MQGGDAVGLIRARMIPNSPVCGAKQLIDSDQRAVVLSHTLLQSSDCLQSGKR